MQVSMFNHPPPATRRRKPVEPASPSQLSRLASYSQRGDARQQAIVMALMLFQRGGGVISRGRATAVLESCSTGHSGSRVGRDARG